MIALLFYIFCTLSFISGLLLSRNNKNELLREEAKLRTKEYLVEIYETEINKLQLELDGYKNNRGGTKNRPSVPSKARGDARLARGIM